MCDEEITVLLKDMEGGSKEMIILETTSKKITCSKGHDQLIDFCHINIKAL
jgi:hypothetical protein